MRFLHSRAYFVTLVLLFCTWGCSGTQIVGIESASSPVLLYDRGQAKEFSAVNVSERFWAPGDAIVAHYILLTQGPIPSKGNVQELERSLPPRQRIYSVDHLPNLAPVLVETGGSESDVLNLNSTIKWVIGIDPVLVAIGNRTEKEWQGAYGGGGYLLKGRARVAGNYLFACKTDADEPVVALIVLDKWPAAFPPGAEIKKNLRRVGLPVGTTLGDVQKDPLRWFK